MSFEIPTNMRLNPPQTTSNPPPAKIKKLETNVNVTNKTIMEDSEYEEIETQIPLKENVYMIAPSITNTAFFSDAKLNDYFKSLERPELDLVLVNNIQTLKDAKLKFNKLQLNNISLNIHIRSRYLMVATNAYGICFGDSGNFGNRVTIHNTSALRMKHRASILVPTIIHWWHEQSKQLMLDAIQRVINDFKVLAGTAALREAFTSRGITDTGKAFADMKNKLITATKTNSKKIMPGIFNIRIPLTHGVPATITTAFAKINEDQTLLTESSAKSFFPAKYIQSVCVLKISGLKITKSGITLDIDLVNVAYQNLERLQKTVVVKRFRSALIKPRNDDDESNDEVEDTDTLLDVTDCAIDSLHYLNTGTLISTMSIVSTDLRKDFIISTAAHYFSLQLEAAVSDALKNNMCLNDFLEDSGCFILAARSSQGSLLHLENKLPVGEGKQTLLVFFKIRPEAVTGDNMHHTVFVASMLDSPVTSLYHTIQRIYAPVLLKDDNWSHNVEPRLQALVTDLEAGLRRVVLRAVPDNTPPSASLSELMSVDDEIHYWSSVANLGKQKTDQQRGRAFVCALEPLGKSFRYVDSLNLADADDIVETAHNCLDDLWKLDEYRYPQERMEHLMEVTGKMLTRFIQTKLKTEDIWNGPYHEIECILNQGLSAAQKYVQICQKLTSLFWPNHSLHRWSGIPYIPLYINKFALRLAEVLKLRTVNRQITRLLTPVEQEQFDTVHNFKCFSGVNAIQYNPYTDPAWQAAVKQFEQKIKPAEERVATKLKQQFRNLNTNTLQLLHEFKRYQELIQQPIVQTILLPERETLLGLLQDYVGSITVDPNTSSIKLVDMPPVVCRIYWVRQMEAKVTEIEKTSALLLNDLGTHPALQRALMNVRKDLKEYHTEQFDSWTQQTLSAVTYKTLGLKTDEPVVYFEQGKLMYVNYNPQLVGLVKEVRQISVMGYTVPHQILEAAELAKRFIKQARALQQVATFHNTIGDRMIASQRPMMLSAAVELARLVREQHSVTWSNTSAVDSYITRLQAAVERLFRENNQLAHYHVQITDKVVALMSTDLLRHQQQWKEGLREIRDIMTKVEEQYSNMKSWRTHWEHQLYKALEHQYQLGLEALNQHMPEIKVDLVYRQQKLQFSPPMEEIRMKYYGQLKRFMAIPLNFRGVSDICIFPSIVDHNAHRFGRVFARAEQLFGQLEKVCDEWKDWVALGSCDLELLAREQLQVAEHWENNFRASKTWGQEIAKLITTEQKLDCFTISVMPVLAEIEQHNRRYWDTLTSSLYSSVLDDIATIDKFITDSKKTLQTQPQCLEEIGEANKQYLLITGKSHEIQAVLERAQKKNRTLATWTKERVDQLSQLIGSWDNFQTLLHNQQYIITKQVETMKNNIVSNVEEVMAAVERFILCWEQMKPKDEGLGSVDILHSNLTFLKEKRHEWDQIMKNVVKLKEEHVQFDMEPPEFLQCNEMEVDLKKQEETWALFDHFNSGLEEMAKEEWIIFRAKGQQKMNKFIANWTDTLSKQPATSLTVRLLQEIDHYKEMVPALKYIRGDMFSEKHWVEMFSILDTPYKPIESLTFGDFLKIRDIIRNKIEALQELNNRAAGEIVIRQTLAELDIWEVDAKFSVTPHTDSKGQIVNLIKHFNDIMNKVGDNQCLLQSIKSSPNYENFRDRASIWETRLTDLDSFLRNLNQIQRKWVYLEPIFGSGTLNIEKTRFERVDRDLRLILGDLAKGDYRVIMLCKIPHLRSTLQMLLQQLTHCQKSLLDFLEVKRLRFPRFYFLSDEDLLEILGQSNKENVIQSHLKKLFAGIHSVAFKGNTITAMQSLQGETVMLNAPVKVTNDVEEWLGNLSKEMKSTLKTLVITCLQSPDPLKFPSQVLCLAERVSFTSRCEQAIQSATLRDLLSSLKSQLEMYTGCQLETSTADGTQEDKDTAVLELKLKALLVDTIYHISVVTQLLESNVSSTGDWHWQRRLRFYMASSGVVVARMVDAEFLYSYEYQGNAPKLVHTPLTDKCYLTLTQAMSMGLGGNPYGPAGTGKTESVKALGGMLGRQVLVFNCDEGIDVQSLTRILVGLVKCGAWGCFDEFNRLEEATLSAISMQIHPIQEALRTSASKVKLLDQEVDVDPNTGIFVTLNPVGKGYTGRQKLPDNLKQLFRPVVMSKPDDTLIAEVILRCEGFKFASSIGYKLVTLFDMAKKLLSIQQHYDWGLRALKTVVGGCGSALQAARANSIVVDGEQDEMALAVRALRLNILSKLTFRDCQNFDTLVQDMFPGIKFESSSHEKLAEAVRECYKDLGLIHNCRQEYKCVELYEQMQQRMGVVIFGPSGSGKSSITKLLKNALIKLGSVVKQHTINAKAMLHTQLLGNIDMDTRQWVDGVLSLTAQTVYAEPSEIESWIVFDSDVDPEWIESLNSVLDDNRLLTLPSGWRIQFGSNVHFLFETHDLSKASPATISRMGMILLSEEDIDQKGLVEAWIKSLPEETSVYLTQFIEDYFYKGVQWVTEHGKPVLQHSLAAIVRSGLSHMSNVATKTHFAAAMMKGLGANLVLSSREPFYKQVLEWTQEFVSDTSQILHFFYDAQRDCIDIHTSETVISNNNLIMTPRMKTARDVLIPWLESGQSFILFGPHGCGKSLLLEHCFSQLRGVQIATVHCSAQITPQHILQKLSQVCMIVSSNYGRVYRPKSTDRLILYIKDINMVRPDKWGTVMLTAWIQQVLTYGAFYDNDMEWVGLENIQLVFSLTTGDTLSPRFVCISNIYCISSPAKQELKSIYTALIQEMILNSSKQASILAATMVNIYLEVKEAFNSVDQEHYIFTPRNITHWCLGLLRYPLTDNQCVLEALLYEGKRQFGDKLVCEKDKEKLDDVFDKVIDMEYSVKSATIMLKDIYFVSESSQMTGAHGTALLRVSYCDCMQLVEKAVTQLGVSYMVILPELVKTVARVERVLTSPGGSLILAGRSGTGRKTAVRIVATRQAATYVTPNIMYAYTISSFKNDLKSAMQTAGMEGEHVYFVLEDYQLLHPEFLDMVNSLLSSGEVPGLYQPEELDANASALKELAATNNFEGNMIQYFTQRVQSNLHLILVLECIDPKFKSYCNNNPALLNFCTIIWMNNLSDETMASVPRLICQRQKKAELDNKVAELEEMFVAIHKSCSHFTEDSPKRYFAFVTTYMHIYNSHRDNITQTQIKLQAGISKLTEARQVVDSLKLEAAEQEKLLADKQEKATAALEMITQTMSNASIHRGDMDSLKVQTEKENEILVARKKEIEAELAEIEPLIREACAAVGNIKTESLSEIRSLRAPPEVIRDILEGVLRLMGIQDTSWNSMKTFLAKRGVKEDIKCFDARSITPESRESVERLLQERRESFSIKTAKRASQAAAPLASWVTANVKYSHVLEKIHPLEREQTNLHRNLKLAEEKIEQLSTGLQDVDKTVAELKVKLNTFTKEAVEIEIHLSKAKETINAAETLVSKLDDEYSRWQQQLNELSSDLDMLPRNSLLAASFVTYLSASSQDVRKTMIEKWSALVSIKDFSLTSFLSTEREQLQWQTHGLPSDQLSTENAIIIIMLEKMEYMTSLRPLLLDPSMSATEWLKNNLSQQNVEVISQSSPRFHTTLDIAIRFGKTLIIEDVDSINPVLFPVLRGDTSQQDLRNTFQLYHVSRNTDAQLEPYAASVISQVNFTTTQAGLTQQLIQCALKQEKPQLEVRRGELLRQEEELKLSLFELQENVLQQLAQAQGDILQNKDLLESLNETKRSSEAISESLMESDRLKTELMAECNVYEPLAEYASKLYFAIINLSNVSNMYQLSVSAFLNLFKKTLAFHSQLSISEKKQKLLELIYLYISRSVFKLDTLMLALHLAHTVSPNSFQPNLEICQSSKWMEIHVNGELTRGYGNEEWNHAVVAAVGCEVGSSTQRGTMTYVFMVIRCWESLSDSPVAPWRYIFYATGLGEWELLTGQAVADIKVDSAQLSQLVPSWINSERAYNVFLLQNVLPDLYNRLNLDNGNSWSQFPQTQPPCSLSSFQHVLLVQALRPDLLHSTLTNFALQTLGIKSLSPPPLRLSQLLGETTSSEPVLIVTSPGTDPSQELRTLAQTVHQIYQEVALGEGQEIVALKLLSEAATVGQWLCLKNLHLMTSWLSVLEKQLQMIEPHDNFRLWLTTEPHPKFSSVLASVCLRVTYEAPQGVKRNMMRTYSTWEQQHEVPRPLFVLAWFHAVVQERRKYIPQGWVKLYEFNDTDLVAALKVLNQRLERDGRDIKWEFIQGLCESAIYGGRVDNIYDLQVLSAYLQLYFDSTVFRENQPLAPGIYVPLSSKFSDHIRVIEKLSDHDAPSFFGLPANIDRSWQRITSSEVVKQLKALCRKTENSDTFDKQQWSSHLAPLLNSWKKLNQSSVYIKMKVHDEQQAASAEPIPAFFLKEFNFGLLLIQHIHQELATISRVIKGSSLPSICIFSLANSLIDQKTPETWAKLWQGPSNPMQYIRSVVTRTTALNKHKDKMKTPLDLSDMFHPEAFLSALRHQSARENKVAVNDLELSCTWGASKTPGSVSLEGLYLEGASFDGTSITANTADSSDVITAPLLSVKWIQKQQSRTSQATVALPLYLSADRESIIAELNMPCNTNEHHKWILAGTAFYIRS